MSVEREVKLGVWPGFVVPDLEGLADGAQVRARDEQHLVARYLDTDDLRLLRSGITLRFRTGEDEPRWTLKLPSTSKGVSGELARSEIDAPGDPGTVPPHLLALVSSRVRTAGLHTVATLETRRCPVDLVLGDDVLLTVVDDEVSVVEGDRVALRFREVEVEVGLGGDRLLGDVVSRLRAAGAGAPDPTPKVVRAVGPRAFDPPDLAPAELGRKPTAAVVVGHVLGRSVRRLIELDPDLRTIHDDEVVHQARVATRRLRSDLKTLAPVIDPGWAEPLRDELAWLGGELGHLRDAQVLRARIAARVEQLGGGDAAAGHVLLANLDDLITTRWATVRSALDGARYLALLDRLVEAATTPVLRSTAGRPAAEVLPRVVGRSWMSVAAAVGKLGPTASDGQLHRVRILAKRARYAADVAAVVFGKPARRLAGALGEVQTVLGEHQDATTAEAWLRTAAVGATGDVGVVIGRLLEQERAAAASARAGWPDAWRRTSRGKLRAWLKD
jgi:CHAD domain-containing protein